MDIYIQKHILSMISSPQPYSQHIHIHEHIIVFIILLLPCVDGKIVKEATSSKRNMWGNLHELKRELVLGR